jgi:hypothetical protein
MGGTAEGAGGFLPQRTQRTRRDSEFVICNSQFAKPVPEFIEGGP